jgi:murein DD-endopeptidase MepM/ murein hydrolase activator NlpD
MAGPAPVVLTAAVAVALLTGLGTVSVPDVRGRSSTGPAAVVDHSGPAAAVPSWRWPVRSPSGGTPAVAQRFRVGPHRWSPGHRGVDLAAATGATVQAAADGVVAFAGSVAGTAVVVVAHDGGIRTTYQPVTPLVRRGQRVRGGASLGTLQTAPSHCRDGPCLHWGALRDRTYLDPLLLVARRRAPVLLPIDP